MDRTSRPRSRRFALVAAAAAAALIVTGCSSDSGGKKAEEDTGNASAGKADTPRMKVAMVTHAAPGDTFWDLIRKGAEAAAAKDNVELVYSNNPDSAKQANLVQNAIDQKVDGIAVTLAKPDAMKSVGRQGGEGRHPGRRPQRRHRRLEGAGPAGVLRPGRVRRR